MQCLKNYIHVEKNYFCSFIFLVLNHCKSLLKHWGCWTFTNKIYPKTTGLIKFHLPSILFPPFWLPLLYFIYLLVLVLMTRVFRKVKIQITILAKNSMERRQRSFSRAGGKPQKEYPGKTHTIRQGWKTHSYGDPSWLRNRSPKAEGAWEKIPLRQPDSPN